MKHLVTIISAAVVAVRNVLLVALDDLDLELLLVAVVGHSVRAVGGI